MTYRKETIKSTSLCLYTAAMVAKINAQRETHSRDIISYAYSRGRLDGSHHSVPVLCQEHVLHSVKVI